MFCLIVAGLTSSRHLPTKLAGHETGIEEDEDRRNGQKTSPNSSSPSNPKAEELYDSSFGWAVFDNLKLAFGISGGGGNGMAMEMRAKPRPS